MQPWHEHENRQSVLDILDAPKAPPKDAGMRRSRSLLIAVLAVLAAIIVVVLSVSLLADLKAFLLRVATAS